MKLSGWHECFANLALSVTDPKQKLSLMLLLLYMVKLSISAFMTIRHQIPISRCLNEPNMFQPVMIPINIDKLTTDCYL